ncbi:hypothetical protein F2P56_025168 [Juglans regia]|uniref:MLO-like protein n=1 Tax=Juglans regia TaxID=51240 RepID=A0A833UPE3_JUGRE|nr:hypothetical protein F2P56_025168 [Juglans regia]
MAGGGGITHVRELDQTPTWAVAVVCAVIILISIILEKVLHMVGEWFQERKKKALFEALEKIKGDTMLPCPLRGGGDHQKPKPEPETGEGEHHRRLLWHERRHLAGGGAGPVCKLGHVPLISVNGLHQLHIFIFFLAAFHVIYSAITMLLGRLKIRGWKDWERESTHDPEFINDPTRFRLTHETSFVKDHTSFWTKSPFSFYFVCFFRQFFRSVRMADYLTLRHGFITVHLAPGSKFDFQKYIKRSLEDDFKEVVGISPLLWASMVFFMLVNVNGSYAMVWVSILPLVMVLSVGTKLQAIITEMALEIIERHAVVQGIPLVQVSDKHFWFSWPRLILYLIHFVLFQVLTSCLLFFLHDMFYVIICVTAL